MRTDYKSEPRIRYSYHNQETSRRYRRRRPEIISGLTAYRLREKPDK